MNIELERENFNDETGAVSGRLWIDGEFFGYTLENIGTLIEPGEYPLKTRFSPKFLKNKIEIVVPGRSYLMFHGGNTPEDSAGCVLVSRSRVDDSNIYGDLSDVLYNQISDEVDSGGVFLTIKEQPKKIFKSFWPFVFAAAAAYILIK